MSAATQLLQAGHEVTILEARMRPGGRVYTLREGFSDGLHAEAGAVHFPDTHKFTLKYIVDLGLATDPIPSRALAERYFIRGQHVVLAEDGTETMPWPVELTAEERELGLVGMMSKYIGEVADSLGDISAASWPDSDARQYDRMSFEGFLRSRGASDGAVDLFRASFWNVWGEGMGQVSALMLLREAITDGQARHFVTVRGGNDNLPRTLAGRLRGQIRYGAAVHSIENLTDRVITRYRQGSSERSIEADFALSTLPFGCLRLVDVRPELSPAKADLVRNVTHTSVTRVYLQTDTRFWMDADRPTELYVGTDLPIAIVRDVSYNQPGTRGLLEGLITGAKAREMANLSESERLDAVLTMMELVVPGTTHHFEGGTSKCWDNDRWTLGDIVNFQPGELARYGPALTAPEGRLYFAGDAGSPWPGWVQGAIYSGHRAAREIDNRQAGAAARGRSGPVG
jgi:monoamine oxidase